MTRRLIPLALSPLALVASSCCAAPAGESRAATAGDGASPFAITDVATFDEPWAMAIDPGTQVIFVTERGGRIKFVQPNGKMGFVSGVPAVDYGGQGGLGDFVIAPGPARATLDERTVFLSWAEGSAGDTRGAAVGRAQMICADHDSCELRDLRVIWRQQPKVTGRGHYSHRIAISPDGRHLFIASGDRQKMAPAQDLTGNLGKILRLTLDGAPAAGNPWAARGGIASQFWSIGHRNVLGLAFDPGGRLWGLEHGPRGGDELNLIAPGGNYGWPVVSQGDHYEGRRIPRHAARPNFRAPAISWNPVIAPGDFTFVTGRAFPEWQGQVLIAGMVYEGLVRVAVDGTSAREVARYPLGSRIRDVAQGSDGAIWVLEDGRGRRAARLRKLSPAD